MQWQDGDKRSGRPSQSIAQPHTQRDEQPASLTPLKTAAHPGGTPIEAFDAIRAGVVADRSQFSKDLSALLWRQSAGLHGLTGCSRRVLAHEHAGRV
jgi:hypothetical protein